MSLYYSRVTPFGFIDPATADDEAKFYGELVTLDEDEELVLAIAEKLRGLWAESGSIQTAGFDSQSQAKDMAELIKDIRVEGV